MLHSKMIEEIGKIVEHACKSDSNKFGYGIWSHHIVYVVKYARQLAEKMGADSEKVLLYNFSPYKLFISVLSPWFTIKNKLAN